MLRAVLILLIYRIALDIEAVIGFITIQAKLLITCKPDPVGSGGFTTAVANIRIKKSGLFWQLDRCILHIKHILRLAALIVSKGVCFGHTFGSGLQYQTYGSAGLTVVERKCLLTTHMEQKVSLTNTTTKHYLNAIHTACIIFRNADNLLIIRKCQIQQLFCI